MIAVVGVTGFNFSGLGLMLPRNQFRREGNTTINLLDKEANLTEAVIVTNDILSNDRRRR